MLSFSSALRAALFDVQELVMLGQRDKEAQMVQEGSGGGGGADDARQRRTAGSAVVARPVSGMMLRCRCFVQTRGDALLRCCVYMFLALPLDSCTSLIA